MFRLGSRRIVAFVLLFCCLSITNLMAFSGGDGSARNPYQIATKADLLAVNNDLKAHYELINDIDLAGEIFTHAVQKDI